MTQEDEVRLAALATTWEARYLACMEAGQRQAAAVYKDCARELRLQILFMLTNSSATS